MISGSKLHAIGTSELALFFDLPFHFLVRFVATLDGCNEITGCNETTQLAAVPRNTRAFFFWIGIVEKMVVRLESLRPQGVDLARQIDARPVGD